MKTKAHGMQQNEFAKLRVLRARRAYVPCLRVGEFCQDFEFLTIINYLIRRSLSLKYFICCYGNKTVYCFTRNFFSSRYRPLSGF